jgi:methionyl-tRNA formyltransferase
MKKPEAIFWGSSKLSAYILEKLLDSGQVEIKAVVTRADQPVGRQKIITATPVAKVAEAKNITILKPNTLDAQFMTEIINIGPVELFIVAAYGKIIPQKVLDIPKCGSLNVHGSLLPKYRGASPIQGAILNGEKTTGATIMQMDAEMDHGPIIAKSEFTIASNDTFETVEDKMAEVGSQLLIKTISPYVEGQIVPETQDETLATYTKLVKKIDGYLDINDLPTEEKMDQMIRAYYPWPNAWTKWNDKIVKFFPNNRIQIEGKNIVSYEEFLRGYPDFPVKR